jgi:hypothetical protein
MLGNKNVNSFGSLSQRVGKTTAAILAAVAAAVVGPAAVGAPIPLQNATATLSQTPDFPASESIDGNLGGTSVANGWAIGGGTTVPQTAVYETQTDVGGLAGAAFTFTLTQNFGGGFTMGKLRFSVTTDVRTSFADGLDNGGDVTANWIELTPLTALATNGATLTIQGDNSILASGADPQTSVYTITASTAVTNITGLRLETLTDASLPNNGPGRGLSGNFVLQEFEVDAVALVPEPAAGTLLLTMGASLALFRRRLTFLGAPLQSGGSFCTVRGEIMHSK